MRLSRCPYPSPLIVLQRCGQRHARTYTRFALEEDVASGDSPCMTTRWFAAADGTLT
jgi:hypothetical protein